MKDLKGDGNRKKLSISVNKSEEEINWEKEGN